MKRVVMVMLCSLIFLAAPLFALTQPVAVSGVQAAPTAPDLSTDLKLQQQKLDFFKELLALQDQRIGDLGLYLAVFGALMTVVVVFFSLRATREAVREAKDEARREVAEQASSIIGKWLREEGQPLMAAKVEASLKPELDKALAQIDQAASGKLEALEVERKKAIENNERQAQLNVQQKKVIDELISRALDKDKPLSAEQKQTIENAAEELQSKPPQEYQYQDWFMLGVQAFESAKYEIAAEHFTKASEVSHDSVRQAMALLNKGVTLGQMERNEAEIAVYDEVLRRYGDAPEAALREQVARALVNKGFTLGQMGQHEVVIAAYDEVLRRYGDAPEAALREQVAGALVYKGIALDEMQQHEAAIAVYGEVLRRYGDAPEAALREQVAGALNGTGFTLLCQAKEIWQGGNETTAAELLKRALEKIEAALLRKPDEPIMLGNQGYILFLLGRVEEARSVLARAIALGGEELRQDELKDAEIHPLPQDEAFKALVTSL